jgi:hypothetical protein
MTNKVRINGVQINLDEAVKVKNLKDLAIFDNDAAYDALSKEIEDYKAKDVPEAKVKVVKGAKAQ